ncbi:MAG: hypothetical protein KatS3mg126_0289 [Lysobacteraceae bacterium]|nr:MAG: hypothetical protein KatS3mg126_0289 [Xanthomonadaceae bacterium]
MGGQLHFALVRGQPSAAEPTLVRVHVHNPLADVLGWQRPDFGLPLERALACIAEAGRGVVVVLGEAHEPDALLARIREEPVPAGRGRQGSLQEWRRNGAGGQILADLGLGKLIVLGTPRRQVGLAGYGLEIVDFREYARQ